MASFLDWLFGSRKPTPPQVPSPSEMAGGHRGVAMGSREAPDRSAENVGQWEQLTGNEVQDFVLHGKPMAMHSSNVASMRYDIKKNQLTVAFKAKGRGGVSVYEYDQVSPQEAIRAAQALSKGSWTIDNLIGRGNVGKRGRGIKPFRKLK